MTENEDVQPLEHIVKGAGLVFSGLIASKLLTWIYKVFIARYFGAADYGLFTLALVVVGLFAMFARLGLHSGLVRFVPFYNAKNDKRRILGSIKFSLKIVSFVSVFFSLILLIFSEQIAIMAFHNASLSHVMQIIALSLPAVCLFYIINFLFVGFKKVKYQVYSEHIFSNVAKIIFVIVFGIMGLGVYGIAWSYSLAMILTFFLGVYFFEKKHIFGVVTSKIKPIYINRELLSFSIPLVLAGIAGFIISSVDTLMLGFFKTMVDVGIYNASLTIAQILGAVPGALLTLFLPVITELYSKKKRWKGVYKTVFKWVVYLNIPLFGVFVFFPSQIMNFIFGPEYLPGYLTLVFLSIAIFVMSLSIFFSNILSVLKKTKIISVIITFSALVNFFLNWMLIPIYGTVGAAIASAITYIVGFCLYFLISWKLTKTSPFSFDILKSIFALILSVLVVNFVPRLFFTNFVHLYIPLLIIFLLLYSFLTLLMKGLDENDIAILKIIEGRIGIKSGFLRKIIKKFI